MRALFCCCSIWFRRSTPSPIDTLFSAHIVQHFLLALVIPPLLLLGTPAFELGVLTKLERAVGQPPVSWLLGVGTMLAWHIPALFNAALANDGLHIFQHLSFLVTGMIFWWPIVGPLQDRHLPALAAVSYLFSACVCCSLLGAFLTFDPSRTLPGVLDPSDYWGLDPQERSAIGRHADVGSRLLRLSFGNSSHRDAMVRGGAHGMTRPTSYAPDRAGRRSDADIVGRGVHLDCVRCRSDRHWTSGSRAGDEIFDMKTNSPWLHRYAIFVASLCAHRDRRRRHRHQLGATHRHQRGSLNQPGLRVLALTWPAA